MMSWSCAKTRRFSDRTAPLEPMQELIRTAAAAPEMPRKSLVQHHLRDEYHEHVRQMENVLPLQPQLKRTDMSDIKSRVIAIIVDKLGVDQGEVTQEASFTNDLGADSLDTVELIMEFEKEFNIAIPDDQAEKIQTVGQAVDYVEKNAK
jgi:acyl carrier protein